MNVIRRLKKFQFPQMRQTLRIGTLILLAYLIPNHVSIHTPFLLTNLKYEYLYIGEKVVQGLGALLLVSLGTIAYRKKVNVLLISFLLLIFALVFYHWGILI
jgi:mannose/fructose/N-acetylgalactosamine-specific phosphotransferase system component IID